MGYMSIPWSMLCGIHAVNYLVSVLVCVYMLSIHLPVVWGIHMSIVTIFGQYYVNISLVK